MEQHTVFSPKVTILLSFIPGLPIWLYGKHKEARWIWAALVLVVLLLLLLPSLVTWYLVCIVYLGQMVYGVWLSIWLAPEEKDNGVWLSIWLAPEEKDKGFKLNANLAAPMPSAFQKVKKLDLPVCDALKREIPSDQNLITAILGFDQQSSQYMFYGVTEKDLVIADCTDKGLSWNSIRIPKDEIAWVKLGIGERNCLMTIRYEEDRYPSVILHIPGKMKKPAMAFIKEFPGTWYEDESSLEIFKSIQKIEWKPQALVTELIGLSFIIFGILPAKDEPFLLLIKLISFTLGFFLLG